MPIPPQYKAVGKWIEAKPLIDQATFNKPWWTIYHDPILNALEARVSVDNNNLKIAVGRFEEAKAAAQVTRSALYPTIDGIGTLAREQESRNFAVNEDSKHIRFSTYLLTSFLTYEIDAWGRVRNSVVAGDSLARASAFDLASLELSLHAQLAQYYFQLRGLDQAQRVLDATVRAYSKSLYLIHQRHAGGMVAASDEDEAVAQLENAKTAATENKLQRAQLEHAIAILIGDIPANFNIQPTTRPFHFAALSPGLPSTLLLRRPDIAAAIERARSANAQIGVARAAFFPQLNFIGIFGVESSSLANLFNSPSILWSVGPSAALTLVQPEIQQVIFDGYKIQGLLKKAKASYFEAINAYKETVLTAFKEVEDYLTAISRLDQEQHTQSKATAASRRALYQSNQQYHGGLVTYVEVVVYENAALQAQLALIDINTRRQLASVQLIKALGGGWYL